MVKAGLMKHSLRIALMVCLNISYSLETMKFSYERYVNGFKCSFPLKYDYQMLFFYIHWKLRKKSWYIRDFSHDCKYRSWWAILITEKFVICWYWEVMLKILM
jgi:hypothetical protein